MKPLRLTLLSIFAIVAILVFQNCNKTDPVKPIDATINILTSKAEWTVSSVNVPVNSATESSEWISFKVSFTKTNMTTSSHPTGAQAVWPSGSYTVSEDGKSITRQDGVLMSLNPITETNFTSIFNIPEGTHLGGSRIAALDGEYTFNMK